MKFANGLLRELNVHKFLERFWRLSSFSTKTMVKDQIYWRIVAQHRAAPGKQKRHWHRHREPGFFDSDHYFFYPDYRASQARMNIAKQVMYPFGSFKGGK